MPVLPDLIGHLIISSFAKPDYEISTFVEMTFGVVYCLLKPDKARVKLYKNTKMKPAFKKIGFTFI